METIVTREIIQSKRLIRVILVGIGVLLTFLGAYVRIPLPFTPVPITLQTLFVILSAALLGTRLGILTQGSYLLLGVTGGSVFSGSGSGLMYLFGPTGGYLFGFLISSFFIGSCMRRQQAYTYPFVVTVFCVADAIILFCGAVWLAVFFKHSIPLVVSIGVVPFVLGDLAKVFAAAVLFMRLRVRFQRLLS